MWLPSLPLELAPVGNTGAAGGVKGCRFQSGRPRRCVEEPMLSSYSFLQHEIGWLLALGQRLRVEYDAVMQPMPPRLIKLLDELRTINGEAVHGPEQGKHS